MIALRKLPLQLLIQLLMHLVVIIKLIKIIDKFLIVLHCQMRLHLFHVFYFFFVADHLFFHFLHYFIR